ncbi:MAG: ABC transporter substrate-binding protein, partial [Pseudomonas sp.]
MKALRQRQSGSVAGALIIFVLVAALIGMGVWLAVQDEEAEVGAGGEPVSSQESASSDAAPAPEEPLQSLPRLAPSAPYVPQDGVVDVDISEYAGYAGLVVANGGLEPNPDSIFAREYGFQVRLTLSEEEGWSKLNSGQVGASVTTADVLAVLGRQFEVVVPAQIAFSRGANQVVVDRNISNINQLKGKVLAASQFNESDFFIRYLASEAGLPIRILRDLDARPSDGELGLVFYEDAFVACDAYAHVLETGSDRLNGCVGWSPRTDQVVAEAPEQAKMLVSNRNLLVIADLLLVNKGFAESQPQMVEGLVRGLMEGNRQLRDTPEQHLALVGRAFDWSEDDTRDELSKVHFSNVPENRAFFAGTIDSAGSYQGIFQSSMLAYGSLISNPSDPARFVDLTALGALEASGAYADQR